MTTFPVYWQKFCRGTPATQDLEHLNVLPDEILAFLKPEFSDIRPSTLSQTYDDLQQEKERLVSFSFPVTARPVDGGNYQTQYFYVVCPREEAKELKTIIQAEAQGNLDQLSDGASGYHMHEASHLQASFLGTPQKRATANLLQTQAWLDTARLAFFTVQPDIHENFCEIIDVRPTKQIDHIQRLEIPQNIADRTDLNQRSDLLSTFKKAANLSIMWEGDFSDPTLLASLQRIEQNCEHYEAYHFDTDVFSTKADQLLNASESKKQRFYILAPHLMRDTIEEFIEKCSVAAAEDYDFSPIALQESVFSKETGHSEYEQGWWDVDNDLIICTDYKMFDDIGTILGEPYISTQPELWAHLRQPKQM